MVVAGKGMWLKSLCEIKHPVILTVSGRSEETSPSRKGRAAAGCGILCSGRERPSPPTLFLSFNGSGSALPWSQTEVLSRCFGALELVLQLSFPLIETCFILFSGLPSVDHLH